MITGKIFEHFKEKWYKRFFDKKIEEWRKILKSAENQISSGVSLENLPPEQKIHLLLQLWVGRGGESDKRELIETLIQNPRVKQEIEEFTQRVIRHFYWPREKIILYRGFYHKGNLSEINLNPWDSLTANQEFAKSAISPLPGIQIGTVLEIEIPIENIFVCYLSHPAFFIRRPEKEFILNERGYKGARLISINGREPSQEELKIWEEKIS